MTTPVSCSLWVDGQWVADGSTPDDDEPAALSGLSISWGRTTTVDQVEPSTVSFELLDPPGGNSFLDLLYTGARVDVTAAGDVQPPSTLPGNRDPSFELAAVGTVPDWILSSGWATPPVPHVVDDRASDGVHSVLVTLPIIDDGAGGAAAVVGVLINIPPAPTSTDPAAWDDLPTLRPGQRWTASVDLVAPPGMTVYVRAGLYRSPADTAPALAGAQVPIVGTTSLDWQTATTYIDGSTAYGTPWVGLRIDALAGTLASWDSSWAASLGAWDDAPPDLTWEQLAQLRIDQASVLAPDPGGVVHRDVTAFSGRITDLDAGWDDGVGGVVCSVIASDFTADLANRDVADNPWPAEALSARFAHIVAAAGVTVPYQIAPTLAAYRMSWMDVDRQQCWPLLADLATSVDGVLWSATHRTTGAYLWLADPRTQSALYVLQLGSDALVHIVPTATGSDALEVDSCDLLLDPTVFRQSVSDVSTRVALTWQDQTVDDKGQPAPTERTNTLIDAAAETALGTRRVAVSTLLTSSADADQVAALILGRLRLAGWRVGGLTWRTDTTDMEPDQVARALDLLDGTRRLAAALRLTNLPDWSPTGPTLPLLLQGGSYTYEDGQWTLNLTTSSAAAQGSSLTWQDVDTTYSWDEFDPTIAWSDLVGVAG